MISKKYIALIGKLAELTATGHIPWEATTKPDTYRANFTNQTVDILKRPTRMIDAPDNYTDYVLRMFNSEGIVIDEIDDNDVRELTRDPSITNMLQEIFETARSQALGVDKALDELFDELDAIIPF